MTPAADGVGIVRARLAAVAEQYPMALVFSDFEGCMAASRPVVADLAGGSDSETMREVEVTPEQGYRLGLGCLALRAEGVRRDARSYASIYAKLSAEHGYAVFDAKLRRRSMYIPVLADEDTLIHEIATILSWRPTFRLVQTMERLKGSAADRIDWAPFGGRP